MKFDDVRALAKHMNPSLDPGVSSLRTLVMALIDTLDPEHAEPFVPIKHVQQSAVLQWTGANAQPESPVDAAKRLGLPVIPTIRGASPGVPGFGIAPPAPPSSPPDEAVK